MKKCILPGLKKLYKIFNMAVNERVIIFSDTRGMKPQHIKAAFEALAPTLEESYLKHDDTLSDEELIRETERLLTDAGISNPLHPLVCCSDEERIEKVVSQLEKRQNRDEIYIVDRDPNGFVEAIKKSSCLQKDTLKSATLLVISSVYPFDYRDKDIGIRIVSFPNTLYRFPTHPTPAS